MYVCMGYVLAFPHVSKCIPRSYLIPPHILPIILFYYPFLHCCNSTKNLSQSLMAFFDRTCLML